MRVPDSGTDDAVRDYIDAIVPEHRPLFDRIHRLVFEAHPDAEVVLSPPPRARDEQMDPQALGA